MKIDVEHYIDTLSKKYNLKILDFRYVFKNKQELFEDTNHLNKNGQIEFAKILEDEVKYKIMQPKVI